MNQELIKQKKEYIAGVGYINIFMGLFLPIYSALKAGDLSLVWSILSFPYIIYMIIYLVTGYKLSGFKEDALSHNQAYLWLVLGLATSIVLIASGARGLAIIFHLGASIWAMMMIYEITMIKKKEGQKK